MRVGGEHGLEVVEGKEGERRSRRVTPNCGPVSTADSVELSWRPRVGRDDLESGNSYVRGEFARVILQNAVWGPARPVAPVLR